MLETIRVVELPDVPVFDEVGVAAALELAEASDPPPIVVLRRTVRLGGKPATEWKVYDGLRRIAAAKRRGTETIPAAVCGTRHAAETLRMKILQAGGAVKFWQSLTPAP